MTVAPNRFVLTNRMNLNGMLSSRIIGPRQSFGKYYQDLLELAGGRVPQLNAAPSPELVEYVSAKAPTGPALLELRPADTSARLPGVALTVAIPLSEVIAIHLPDERALREHQARRYKNVHPHDDLLKVSPDLFNGSATLDDVRQAGSSVASDPALTPQTDWQRIDRLRGAMSAAVFAATTGRSLQTAGELLPNGPSGDDILARCLSTGDRTIPGTTEGAFLAAVVDILMGIDVRQAWNPQDIVAEVRETTSAGRTTGVDVSEIEANLDSVAAVISNKRPFTPFRRKARGLRTAKALLLVLLREELPSLATWAPEETGADDMTRQMAMIFAGLLRGLSRESVSTRSLLVDDHTARWACDPTGGGRVDSVVIRRTRGTASLEVAGERVRSVSLNCSEIFRSMGENERQAALPPLATILNSDDAITLAVTSYRSSSHLTDKGELITAFPATASITYGYDLATLTEQMDDLSEEQADRVRAVLIDHVVADR
ncbi:hypothetical protein ODJ79_44985 [Actinoplanes sp. KI2]|uniref:hypothetical protein n=1 Tax=Actinoplanes sp. KI2 TaxID=2983315 RepID=UPI0021D5F20E|nr:hypothetical protein [Actinoplanes sp. KI2]MCU7730915.1 hypothetical protein [Actinoplanes sp. KI2]